MIQVLLIDDDPLQQQTMQALLCGEFRVYGEETGSAGLRSLEKIVPDLVLLDINLPDANGLEILKKILQLPNSPPVLIISGYGNIRNVVKAIKSGAYDFITKPFSFNELKGSITKALQNQAVIQYRHLCEKGGKTSFPNLIGESISFQKVKSLIAAYAPSDGTILLSGESGTGKDLIAKTIHNSSSRKNEPFVPINCGAIPDTLIESELFGSQKGGFTGATDRQGCFERASGGTIFLDEIGEMNIPAQVKLLRVIEEKTVTRIGGSRPIHINIRIIAASNRNLKKEVEEKNFRKDLYYRLSILPISLAPLRDRIEDLSPIAVHFLNSCGSGTAALTPEAVEKLKTYSWPGNIRELRNVLERATLLSENGVIKERHILFL